MEVPHNYLVNQYRDTNARDINHNYLQQQFADCEEILREIEELVRRGDYTLGESVNEFENNVRSLTASRYALGVASGTDALELSLRALGIGPGDEVITTPYTFIATVGAIVTAGARPVFVDIREDYNIDPDRIEEAIGPATKCILPVHWRYGSHHGDCRTSQSACSGGRLPRDLWGVSWQTTRNIWSHRLFQYAPLEESKRLGRRRLHSDRLGRNTR